MLWFSKQLGKSGEQENAEEMLETRQFPEGTHPATVMYSRGVTINMGNYQTARVDVGIVLPCFPEEVEQVWEYGQALVAARLEKEVERLREARGSKE